MVGSCVGLGGGGGGAVIGQSVLGLVEVSGWVWIRAGPLRLTLRVVFRVPVTGGEPSELRSALDRSLFKSSVSVLHAAVCGPWPCLTLAGVSVVLGR